jgi:hypothetical protein
MAHYRVYEVDYFKSIVSATDLQCPDDKSAMEAASAIARRGGLEVWSGGRHVVTLPHGKN